MPTGPSVQEHVEGCPQCRELLRDAAALGRRLADAASQSPESPGPPLAAVSSAIDAERGLRAYLRSRSTRTRWLLSLSLPAILLVRELLRKRVPWRSLGAPRLLGGLVLLALLALATQVALRPLPVARRAARLRMMLAVTAWFLPCLMWFAPETSAGSDTLTGNFALRSFGCFAYGSALAAPSFALLWALDRGVVVPFRVWALGAGVVALFANLILIFHCPVTDRAHLVAGHFSIGLAWFAAVWATERWRRHAQV